MSTTNYKSHSSSSSPSNNPISSTDNHNTNITKNSDNLNDVNQALKLLDNLETLGDDFFEKTIHSLDNSFPWQEAKNDASQISSKLMNIKEILEQSGLGYSIDTPEASIQENEENSTEKWNRKRVNLSENLQRLDNLARTAERSLQKSKR